LPTNKHLTVRGFLRDTLVVAAAVVTSPLWLLAWLETVLTGGEGVFKSCSEFLSLFPGKLGIFLRRGFYGMCLESFATDCSLGFGTLLAHPQVRIGTGVYIGDRCTLGKVVIENDVAIGSNVDVLSGRRQHHFGQLEVPILKQGRTFERIRIGRNAWIGNSAVVMADVGDESIIGAGSVVVHPIPARSIAAGNPAIVKKTREPAHEADMAHCPELKEVDRSPCCGS
jgi:acetyltransferase-like isoleucine patch superfamily enzyme